MSSSPKSWGSASSNLNFTIGILTIHSHCTHLKSTSMALFCFVSPFLWASLNDFLISGLWMVLSTLLGNAGDFRFWTVSPGLQIRVWNLPNNHQSLPFLVDATLWHEISNILCCLSYFINIEHFRLNSGIPLKYKQQNDWQVNNMVASKPIRSNVTIPTTSFGEMMSWAVHYDIIYHFSIFEDLRGWQPCVESHFVFKETNMQSEHVVLKILGLGFLAYSVRFRCLRADLAVHVIAIFFVNHPLTFSARAWIIFFPWI